MNDFENNKPSDLQEFYTENYSHPHPLVRIMNIIQYFVDCVKEDFPKLKIDLQQVINNVLGVNKLYFSSLINNPDTLKPLFIELESSLDKIHRYNNRLYDVAINDDSIKLLLNRSGVIVSA